MTVSNVPFRKYFRPIYGMKVLLVFQIDNNKKAISDSCTLYDRMVKCSKILSEIRGEETNIFPHTCRHSRIECLQRGEDNRLKDENGNNKKYPLEQIMVFVHHSDVSTTQSYLKDTSEETINDMFNI